MNTRSFWLVLSLSLLASQANADWGPSQLREDAFYVSPGVGVAGGGDGFQLTAEISGAYFAPSVHSLWVGGYIDTQWTAENNDFVVSVGPEFGWSLFGLEAGYMHYLRGPRGVRHGVRARLHIRLAWFGVFAGVSYRDDGRVSEHFGVLLKLPLQVSGDNRGMIEL